MEQRKTEHITLAGESAVEANSLDQRFYYEPLLSGHPTDQTFPFTLAGKEMKFPIWISSMTGGTAKAKHINQNLAKACKEFGLGMALGSCRPLLENNSRFDDFNIRPLIGDNLPLFANIGICQLEELINTQSTHKLEDLVGKLKADGLIIHINPLQEAIQPEGDKQKRSPIYILDTFLEYTQIPIIIKEVGQGFGPESLKALLQLPIEAIEFGAFGGTNFAKLETLRANSPIIAETLGSLINVGHSAQEMVEYVNSIVQTTTINCKNLIISGGIKNALDGYYLTHKSQLPSIFGMGFQFLKHAEGDYSELKTFVQNLIESYRLANAFLRVR